jgi:perosamine synthetase
MIPFGRPVLDQEEIDAVSEVLRGHTLTHGPAVARFEAQFAELVGVPHAVAVSSCTAALHLSLMALDVGPGDEVIVPAQTHVATAHAAELCGARPVFADVDPATGNIAVDQIEARLTERTKAIIVVHFLGLPCDMDPIQALAASRGVPVVEDCALAIGTRYRSKAAGAIGLTGCFSFYPIKHITTGEGGMLTTNDPAVAARASKQRAFGIDRGIDQRAVPGFYDVTVLGHNYRMSEIQAVLGLAQLAKLPEMAERRSRNMVTLRQALSALDAVTLFRQPAAHETCGNYCLSMQLKPDGGYDRDTVALALKSRAVGTSIYYATPVPLMTFYREKYGYQAGDFPHAESVAAQTISLPVGAHLGDDDAQRIGQIISEVLGDRRLQGA